MLLIHTCCADCVLKFLDSAKTELGFTPDEIVLYFYNPNIHPRSEYLSRLKALKKVNEKLDLKVIIPDYRPSEYFAKINRVDKLLIHNKKLRCPHCWALRLTQAFSYAKENGFSHVSSTLVTSQYQDRETIQRIASNLATSFGLEFFSPVNSTCEAHNTGFYKQNFCGCVYSLQERLEEKFH